MFSIESVGYNQSTSQILRVLCARRGARSFARTEGQDSEFLAATMQGREMKDDMTGASQSRLCRLHSAMCWSTRSYIWWMLSVSYCFMMFQVPSYSAQVPTRCVLHSQCLMVDKIRKDCWQTICFNQYRMLRKVSPFIVVIASTAHTKHIVHFEIAGSQPQDSDKRKLPCY